MDAVAIGDVDEHCKRLKLNVLERWPGEPLDYRGPGKLIVWGGYHRMFEFYYVKYRLLRRGITLLGIQDYGDLGDVLDQFVKYLAQRDHETHRGGRSAFGWQWVDGKRVPVPEELRIADRVLLLRESGCSYREIVRRLEQDGMRTKEGKAIGITLIAGICRQKKEGQK